MILNKKKSQELGAWANYSKLNHQWNSKKKRKHLISFIFLNMDNTEGNNQTQTKNLSFSLLNLEISNQGVSANFSDCEKILLSVLGSGRSTCLQATWSHFSSSNSFSFSSTQSHHTGTASELGTSSMPSPIQGHSNLSFNFNLNITPSQWSSQTNSPQSRFPSLTPLFFHYCPQTSSVKFFILVVTFQHGYFL